MWQSITVAQIGAHSKTSILVKQPLFLRDCWEVERGVLWRKSTPRYAPSEHCTKFCFLASQMTLFSGLRFFLTPPSSFLFFFAAQKNCAWTNSNPGMRRFSRFLITFFFPDKSKRHFQTGFRSICYNPIDSSAQYKKSVGKKESPYLQNLRSYTWPKIRNFSAQICVISGIPS